MYKQKQILWQQQGSQYQIKHRISVENSNGNNTKRNSFSFTNNEFNLGFIETWNNEWLREGVEVISHGKCWLYVKFDKPYHNWGV